MPYQRETVDYAKTHPYSIIALEQGLGKSAVAIATAIETNSRTLIVCPAYLKLKWKSEINKFYPGKEITILDKKEHFYFPFDSDFVIISYSFLHVADVLFEWADLVVVDEAQMLKETSSKRSEAFHRLIFENSTKRCLLLTGTPILNRVYEFYSLIAICNYNPKIKESKFLNNFPTYVQFANYFSYLYEREIYRGNKKVKVSQWEGYRNVDELREYLKDCYIRFRSKDVLDLPDSIDIIVPVDSQECPELLDAFNSFAKDNTSVLPAIKAKAALAKAALTIEYVKTLLEQDLQVVVYSDHVEAAETMAKKLGTTAITGKTDMNVRTRMGEYFQSGKLKVLVATIGSFSTGVDLQSGFNMVFNDFPWVSGVLEQAKFRIKRVGQKERCVFHYIVGSAQDEIILNRLEDKSNTIKAVVG